MWYYAQNGTTFGPISLEELKALARAGTLKPTDHVLPVGSQEWRLASTQGDLFARQGPPPKPTSGSGPPPMQLAAARPASPPQMPDESFRSQGQDTWSLASHPYGDTPPSLGYPSEEPSFGRKIGRHFTRLFTWNLQKVGVDEDEKRFLAAQGVEDPTLQRYLSWRHSVLLILVFPVFLLALLNTIDHLTGELSNLNGLGKGVLVFFILFPFALPFTAVLALIVWYRQKLSWRLLLIGWIVGTAGPLFIYLVPAASQFDMVTLGGDGLDERGRQQLSLLVRILAGGAFFGFMMLQLPIFAITAAYGTQRACLRLKTLLPESGIPGLFMAITAPIFPLLLLPFFVMTSQLASNPLLFLGMICMMGSPLIYSFHFKRMISPFLQERDFTRLRVAQIIAMITFWVGVLFLLIYAFAVPVPFLDVERLQRPGGFNRPENVQMVERTILGISSETSWLRPWSWKLIRWVLVEVMGRSLFTMILVADLFMRVNSYMWISSRKVMGSDQGKNYDELMDRLQKSGRWDESIRTQESGLG